MNRLHDQHLHSRHSFDSGADPAENCLAAIHKGLAGLTFTEHYDRHPTEWPNCRFDYGKISETIAACRERFGERIFVGKGIEVCYQPEQMTAILDFLENHAFDLVILSVHWSAGRSLYDRESWAGRWQQRTREYLTTVLEAGRFCQRRREAGEKPFDVLGHLDLAKRYSVRFCGTHDLHAHADLVDEILRTCIAADLAPEINTSTLRQGLDEPMPAEWVVGRYVELGGRYITLGSDAHTSGNIGADLPRAARMIQDAGLRHLSVFRGREPHGVPLQEQADK